MKFPQLPDLTHLKDVKSEAAPWDSRFPNQNQTKHCYQSYVDYQRCKKIHGEEYEACKYFKNAYQDLCPAEWVEKWNEQIEEGRFPGRI